MIVGEQACMTFQVDVPESQTFSTPILNKADWQETSSFVTDSEPKASDSLRPFFIFLSRDGSYSSILHSTHFSDIFWNIPMLDFIILLYQMAQLFTFAKTYNCWYMLYGQSFSLTASDYLRFLATFCHLNCILSIWNSLNGTQGTEAPFSNALIIKLFHLAGQTGRALTSSVQMIIKLY